MPSKDKEKIKTYFAGYYERNRVAILTHQAEYQKQYSRTETGKANKIANTNRMVAKYPEKYKARYILRNAVRLGKIKRGYCGICGSLEVESHHDDYSKPLEVRWFCWLHHRELEGRWVPKVNLERR